MGREVPPADQQTGFLKRGIRRSAVSLFALVALWGCGHGCPLPLGSEVAGIFLSNDTAADLRVSFFNPDTATYSEESPLKGKTIIILLKYEEPRYHPTPVENFVNGLRLKTTSGCVATLDQGGVVKSAERDKERRQWIIHVSPALLAQAGCR
jgi:hypothetical protein